MLVNMDYCIDEQSRVQRSASSRPMSHQRDLESVAQRRVTARVQRDTGYKG